LFIGLLVNTMQSAVEDETEAEFEQLRALVRAETDEVGLQISALTDEVRALKAELIKAQETKP
jgi:voltage-gated sodium channel